MSDLLRQKPLSYDTMKTKEQNKQEGESPPCLIIASLVSLSLSMMIIHPTSPQAPLRLLLLTLLLLPTQYVVATSLLPGMTDWLCLRLSALRKGNSLSNVKGEVSPDGGSELDQKASSASPPPTCSISPFGGRRDA